MAWSVPYVVLLIMGGGAQFTSDDAVQKKLQNNLVVLVASGATEISGCHDTEWRVNCCIVPDFFLRFVMAMFMLKQRMELFILSEYNYLVDYPW